MSEKTCKKRKVQNKDEENNKFSKQRKCSGISCKSTYDSTSDTKIETMNYHDQKTSMPHEILLTVSYKNKEIPVVINYIGPHPDGCERDWIVLTHGAGGDLSTPQLKSFAFNFALQNYVVARFTCRGLNIKYRITIFGEILSYIYQHYSIKKIFIGGRSMGARAATMLVTDEACDSKILFKLAGVICLSYPLHKIGDVSELREKPLVNCNKPIFFLSGSKDEMCNRRILEKVLKNMKTSHQLHWLKGYDHSAKSNKSFSENAYINAFTEIEKWCQRTNI